MKTGIKKILAGLVTVLWASASYAVNDAYLSVTGSVIASTCLTGTDATYSINLGENHLESDFANPSSYSDYVTQDVIISDCPTEISTITATFSGTPDANVNTHYANVSGVGYAENISVQLQNRMTASDVGNGTAMAVSRDDNNQAVFPLQARLFSFQGGSTAGQITVPVTMNITYN